MHSPVRVRTAGRSARRSRPPNHKCVVRRAGLVTPDRASDAARIAAGQAQGVSRVNTDLLSRPGKATGNRRGSGYHHGCLDRS